MAELVVPVGRFEKRLVSPAKLEAERERLLKEQMSLTEEKSALSEDRVRLEAELNTLKNRGFWARLFGAK